MFYVVAVGTKKYRTIEYCASLKDAISGMYRYYRPWRVAVIRDGRTGKRINMHMVEHGMKL